MLDLFRFRVIPIGDLHEYEVVGRHHVNEIRIDLAQTRLFSSPVCADISKGILIDGHHRVHALRQLGLSLVLAYDVEYFGEEVEVREWVRSFPLVDRNTYQQLLALFEEVTGGNQIVENKSGCQLRLHSSGRLLRFAHLHSKMAAAWLLDKFCQVATTEGLIWELVADRNQHCAEVDLIPIVGKADVQAAIQSRCLLPTMINRHLIDGRPLEVNLPLEILERSLPEAEFEARRHIGRLASELSPGSVSLYGRHYEERVRIFS